MTMPRFSAGDDPGASFPDLLRKVGMDPFPALGALGGDMTSFPHATTCLALTYDGGVVMAGDRRATAGMSISHRTMDKVVQADDLSGVAIAGTAGPADEPINQIADIERRAMVIARTETLHAASVGQAAAMAAGIAARDGLSVQSVPYARVREQLKVANLPVEWTASKASK
ncbi:MAG: hypothetical protein ACO27J_03035 [Ilumatobacteraceae bacterium]